MVDFFKNLFENVGGKLKTLAMIYSVIGIVVSIIGCIILFAEELVGAGFLVLIFGPIVSVITSYGLYAYGELTENSNIIAKHLYRKKTDDAAADKKTQELLMEISAKLSQKDE